MRIGHKHTLFLLVFIAGCAGTISQSAFKEDSTVLLESVIIQGADVNKPYSGGVSPLMYAAGQNDCNSVEILLAHGAKLNNTDRYGKTALMHAVSTKALEAVEILILNGADVDL